MLVESLQNEFGLGVPILTEEILELFNNFTKAYVFRLIKKEEEKGNLVMFSRGIYYLPKSSFFGQSAICSEMVAEKKYIKNRNLIYGIYSGLSILNRFGITTQVPNRIEIVTNNESTRKRVVNIGGKEYVIKKSRCEITKDNVAEYTVLTLFSEMNEKDNLDEFSMEQLRDYIRKNKVDREKLFEMAIYFPASTSKRMIRSGLLNGTF